MGKRITIQDIADSLGVSRNTVSKALNNTGVLADATRDRILQKAAELGYKQFSYYPPLASIPKPENCEIALFTRSMPNSSHFGSKLLNTFQEKISSNGYRLSFFLIREQEFAELQLPAGFDLSNTAGIICLELFDYAYSQMLSKLDIPLLFTDCASNIDFTTLDADFLFMENRSSISSVVQTLIKDGQHRLAFAGDINNCHSFFERYQGFSDALRLSGLKPVTDELLANEPFHTVEQLASHIKQLPELPDAFICANDFVAMDLMKALKKCGLSVPKDVKITGFDNSAESQIIEPHLTTVHIPSSAMGYIAAELLLSRIEEPGIPYRTTYVRTVIKYRESSRC
ncbi:LacI family DNA-binding transcriptional regulator [Blautia pseudococcoides]|uniref:LacI family DNA-binding transcriptional regulator n=1 Tax=Blautia pseudococcoides TaxID=1796616 RepID=UPI00148B12EC|nr:LacI family DNA-binding transcriptional regulator [Blautia pseudococcoides]QJU15932.1 LacI family DNA-binding transcriptional regulator [Blautia pseudococcoides]